MLKRDSFDNDNRSSMSLEGNKKIISRLIDAINTQNLDILDELVTLDYVDFTHHHNLEDAKKFMTMVYKAFPDYHEIIEDIIAEGDKIWT